MKRKLFFLIAVFQLASFQPGFTQTQPKIDSLTKALKTAKEDTSKAIIFINLSGEALNYNPDSATLYGQQALTLSEKLNFMNGRIQSLNALGNAAHYSSKFPLALSYANQSLKLAEQAASKRGILEANISLGNIYDDMGDVTHAKDYFLKAMKMAEEINEKHYLNLGLAGLTNVYGSSGDYQNAMVYALKGLTISEENNNSESISIFQFDIGTIYQMQKKFEESLKHLFIALQMQKDIGAKKKMTMTYYRIAQSYTNLKKYDDAATYYNLALNLSGEIKQKKWGAAANDGLGQVLMLKEKYNDAIPYFQKEISIAEEIGDKEGMSIGYGNMGWAYQKGGHFGAALKYMHQSLAIAKEMGLKESVIDCYNQLAACYYESKDYKNAYDYFDLYQSSNDSLRNKEATDKTAELEAQYSSEKKENQIALLSKDKEVRDAELKKEKQLKNSFIAGFTLLALLSVFVFNNFRVRNKLRLQNIRNKIASDLHDDIGSTLNSISVYSEVAKQKSPTAVNELEQIGEASRKIIDAMSDIVWTINPKNDSFENIILRMRSLSYNLLKAKNIEHIFRADEDMKAKLSLEERRNFYLIFKEALNNLVKYSGATRVSIILSHENKLVKLSVRDNGKGFDARQISTGNGLFNMRSRAAEMYANIKIESEPGKGTTIELALKV